MVILHIARIVDNLCNGVCVVVPQHVLAQQQFEEAGIVNVTNFHLKNVRNQFEYSEPFLISKLPEPFNRPDLVVFHEVYRPVYLRIYRMLMRNNIRYVIVPHGELTGQAQNKKWLKKKTANFLLFNRFINNAVAIQCLSQSELDKTKFKQKKFIATNGIDMPSERKQEFSSNGVRFVYIGRLDVYHKGLDLMIEAVGKCKKEFLKNNAKIDLYGPDFKSRFTEVEKLIARNDVGDVIALHREVFGEEKRKILLGADCFVQTSRFEGMPMGILEAMSYGIPCLVTDGTTLGDTVAQYDAGWACNSTVESVASAFQNVLFEKSRFAKKSRNAVTLVESRFRWQKVASDTIKNYKDLTGKV